MYEIIRDHSTVDFLFGYYAKREIIVATHNANISLQQCVALTVYIKTRPSLKEAELYSVKTGRSRYLLFQLLLNVEPCVSDTLIIELISRHTT